MFLAVSLGMNGTSENEFVEVYPSDSEEESKELTIRETFPQYRINFNSRRVQEEVFEEFLKEKKENGQKKSSDL